MCGNRSLIVSHKSEGFDEYKGLDWTSHLILPESAMFERSLVNEDYGISPQELMNSKLIPPMGTSLLAATSMRSPTSLCSSNLRRSKPRVRREP